MFRLKEKIPQILNIFINKLDSLGVVTSDMDIIGLRFKDYYIKDMSMYDAGLATKQMRTKVFTYGGLAKELAAKVFKLKLIEDCTETQKALLRKYFYQNRVEFFTTLAEYKSSTDLLSIDFNHLYLNIMKTPLPHHVKKLGKRIKHIELPGFYYIKYYAPYNYIPVLPQIINNETLFTYGNGEGLYWYEEILFFMDNGGEVLESEAVLLYEEQDTILRPFMEYLEKIPNRRTRKTLANHFYGHMGMKGWKYKKYLANKADFDDTIPQIKRTKQYGSAVLIETYQLVKINNKVENLGLALAIMAKARIEVHKYLQALMQEGIKIIAINTDEIIVDKNTLPGGVFKAHSSKGKNKGG